MELTLATPIEMVVYYADLRNEYESSKFSPKQKMTIFALACKRYSKIDKNDLDESGAFKEDVNYDWDELDLSLPEEFSLEEIN